MVRLGHDPPPTGRIQVIAMARFVTFGETMVQYNASYVGPFTEDGDYMKDCAGAESNVAVNLGKLAVAGLETVWVSRLGDDDEAEFILGELHGRTTVAAERHKGERTGISYLNHFDDGQPLKTYRRKGSAASRLEFRHVEPYLKTADLLHVTGITPALSGMCRETVDQALAYAREHKIPVSFDANYREPLWSPGDARAAFEEMLPGSWLLKVGYDEAEQVWGMGLTATAYAKHFQRQTGGMVVVTMAEKGAIVYDGASMIENPGCQVTVVDPVGAGDAFVAGFLGTILEQGAPARLLELDGSSRAAILERSLEVANVCGALTCTRRGDTAAMPNSREVREFLAGSPNG